VASDDHTSKKKSEAISDLFGDNLRRSWADLIFVEDETEAKLARTIVLQFEDSIDKQRNISLSPTINKLSALIRRSAIENELKDVLTLTDPDLVTTRNFDRLLGDLIERKREKVDLSVSSVIIPERKITEGVLVKATSVVWASVLEELEKKDWVDAHEIPPRVWEEIIAGAFVKAGFDEVILTPRSNDHGRDVIAIRKGIGSIKNPRLSKSLSSRTLGHKRGSTRTDGRCCT